MKVSDAIDILDTNDVYCPTIVTEIIQDRKKIRISYMGWGPEWDEILPITSPRISSERKTKVVKAWVRFNLKLPVWPCKIYIRYPLEDSLKGKEYLQLERRVLLVPYGPATANHLKPYKHGVWISVAKIEPFVCRKSNLWIQQGRLSKLSASFTGTVFLCCR